MQQAIKQHSAVRKEGVQLRENDSCRKINLQVLPLSHAEVTTPNYLVLFESGTEAAVVRKTEGLAPDAALLRLAPALAAQQAALQALWRGRERRFDNAGEADALALRLQPLLRRALLDALGGPATA